MKPVIQEEKTGCAIASAAAIAGLTYREAKRVANGLGIYAEDELLWSDTRHIRTLLGHFGIKTGKGETDFKGWDLLPELALLATKWHIEKGKPVWHWAVFVKAGEKRSVLDSKKSLKKNVRTDFGRMKPTWYIELDNK